MKYYAPCNFLCNKEIAFQMTLPWWAIHLEAKDRKIDISAYVDIIS